MTTKLTLSVKKDIVEKAKRLAAQQGKSVSRLVEDYFENFKEPKQKSIVERMDELMAPHRDRINQSLGDMTYKEAIAKWRDEDFAKEYDRSKANKTSRKKSKAKA